MYESQTPEEQAELVKLNAMREKAIQDYIAIWSKKTPDARLFEADRLQQEAAPDKTTLQLLERLIMEMDACPATPEAKAKWKAIASRKAEERLASGTKTTATGCTKL